MLALLALVALAEEPTLEVKPILHVRPRFEVDTGRDGEAEAATWFVTQRTRLGLIAKYGPLTAKATVQDVRRWGEEGHTLLDFDADGIDLHEGWARWTPRDEIEVTLGRQEMEFKDHRWIGNVEWAPQGRSFDGARAALTIGALSGEVVIARLADPKTPLHEEGGGVMAVARAGFGAKTVQGDAIGILQTDEPTEMTRGTFGGYGRAALGSVAARADAYGQLGERDGDPIRAWMAHGEVTWTPPVAGKPSFTAWYDVFSGDPDPTDGPIRAFDTIYATNHKHYGFMDVVMFRTGGWVDGRGLHDAALKLGAKPHEQVEIVLDLHAYLATAPQGGSAEIGEEVDLVVKTKLAKPLGFDVGGAAFRWPDGDLDGWAYLQVDAKL